MDFGSEFVYSYSDSEEEEISSEAIEKENSIPEDVAQTLSAKSKSGKRRSKLASLFDCARSRKSSRSTKSEGVSAEGSGSSTAGQKWRCADTNVVVVKFDRLTEPSNMHTGDPIVCSGCQVMLSHISKITQHGKNEIWTCEFCETKNKVDIVPEEIPSKTDVTYMLEPTLVASASDSGSSGKTECQESIVVFCIDCSRSMSTIVAGSGNSRISRLDGVKIAVCHQLERLSDTNPGCRVAVVAFAGSVKVIADGKNIRERCIRNDIFDDNFDKTELLKVASELNLPSKICYSRKTLTQNVLGEPTSGNTALGPGLLVSVGIARKTARSKVIVCTDGEANVGLGSLDDPTAASTFYTEVADIAKESGVSVSVLTIAGTDCKLVELGRVAELTGGQVNIVDTQTVIAEFENILEDAIIATHATARFILHRDLYVRGKAERPSHALLDIGNVTRGAELFFEYGFRSKKKPKTIAGCKGAKKDDDGDDKRDEPVRLPFQIQIRYTDSNGAKAVRVFTETKPITKDRKEAENSMNISILGTHAVRDAADKALNAKYMESRLTDCAYTKMFHRNAKESEHFKQGLDKYEEASKPVKGNVMSVQKAEAKSKNSSVMDNEKMLQKMEPDEVRRQRRQVFDDKFAEGCYKGMKLSSDQFAKTTHGHTPSKPVPELPLPKPMSSSPLCETSSAVQPTPTVTSPPMELHDQSKADDKPSAPLT